MAILDKQGLQHYANKMCNADNRKVGSKSLPTALNEIDIAIDGFKTLFETEYGTPINMELENNENVFSIGTGINIDKKNDVENSFTDVELSGNSLVNITHPLYPMHIKWTHEGTWKSKFILCADAPNINADSAHKKVMFNPRDKTTYTIVCNVIKNTSSANVALHNAENTICMFKTHMHIKPSDVGILKFVQTADYSGLDMSRKDLVVLRTQSSGVASGEIEIADIMILEGDWGNKPLPQYFQGLKSIGEKEDGNHKISILSLPSNPNLIQTHCTVPLKANWNGNVTDSPTELIEDVSCPNGKYIKILCNSNDKTEVGRYVYPTEKLEIGKKYSWSFWCKSNKNLAIRSGAEQGGTKIINITPTWQKFTHTFTATNSVYWAFIFYLRNAQVGDYICVHSIKLEEGESITDWCPNDEEIYKNLVPNYSKSDKKEILLNEPLRGLPNGVRDSVEKINGEWKIVRRCEEIVLNGSENWGTSGMTPQENTLIFQGDVVSQLVKPNSSAKSDKFATYNSATTDEEGLLPFSGTNGTRIYLRIKKSKLSSQDVVGFKKWLSQNPTKVVYELATPIIEDISPVTLQCWKNGTISIDEVLPIETTHTVALNKSAQIQKNIEELTTLRNRVKALEEQYDKTALNQAYEVELLRLDMQLDNII